MSDSFEIRIIANGKTVQFHCYNEHKSFETLHGMVASWKRKSDDVTWQWEQESKSVRDNYWKAPYGTKEFEKALEEYDKAIAIHVERLDKVFQEEVMDKLNADPDCEPTFFPYDDIKQFYVLDFARNIFMSYTMKGDADAWSKTGKLWYEQIPAYWRKESLA